MATTRSRMSIAGLTSTGAGNTVQLRTPRRAFNWGVTLTATTSVKIKLQGTVDMAVWNDISTATVVKTSQSGLKHASTSAAPYSNVRLICTSMTTKNNRKIVGFVEGY